MRPPIRRYTKRELNLAPSNNRVDSFRLLQLATVTLQPTCTSRSCFALCTICPHTTGATIVQHAQPPSAFLRSLYIVHVLRLPALPRYQKRVQTLFEFACMFSAPLHDRHQCNDKSENFGYMSIHGYNCDGSPQFDDTQQLRFRYHLILRYMHRYGCYKGCNRGSNCQRRARNGFFSTMVVYLA